MQAKGWWEAGEGWWEGGGGQRTEAGRERRGPGGGKRETGLAAGVGGTYEASLGNGPASTVPDRTGPVPLFRGR